MKTVSFIKVRYFKTNTSKSNQPKNGNSMYDRDIQKMKVGDRDRKLSLVVNSCVKFTLRTKYRKAQFLFNVKFLR